MTRIAIMQPYFIPYAGYFRLFAATDLFVIYDCVQFPRRGWVHRNKLTKENGEADWLTLPLKKADRDIKIKDLEFSEQKDSLWSEQLARFPLLSKYPITLEGTPVDFIVSTMKNTCEQLGLHFNAVKSSSLNLPDDLRAQDRILAIAKHFGATEYINAPGGRELYDEAAFNQHNIKLSFLPDWQGSFLSVAERIAGEGAEKVRGELF